MIQKEVLDTFAYVQGLKIPPSAKRKSLLGLGIKTSYTPHQGKKELLKAARVAAKRQMVAG